VPSQINNMQALYENHSDMKLFTQAVTGTLNDHTLIVGGNANTHLNTEKFKNLSNFKNHSFHITGTNAGGDTRQRTGNASFARDMKLTSTSPITFQG
jgi:hypothetical protein